MRKNRIQVASVLLLLSLLLTGCSGNVKNYVHTDSSLKREAADALEEKYDEEFVIHDVWTMSQTMFYATCSPEDEQDIVFEAKVYKDGRGVYSDEYIQGAVSKQLESRVQPRVEEVFGECFVKITFAIVEKPLDYYNGVSIEEYFELYEDEHLYVQIFVNAEKIQNSSNNMSREYECLSYLFKEEGIMEGGGTCYFVNTEEMNACKDYFITDSKERSGSEPFQGLQYFWFGYDEGVINRSFEDYIEVREEINTNE